MYSVRKQEKKNYFIISALVLAAGINFSCRHRTEKLSEDEELMLIDEEDEKETALANSETFSPRQNLFHPKEYTFEATQALLYTFNQPDPKDIQKCDDQLELFTAAATDDASLKKASIELKAFVASNVRLYHWCFYQKNSRLEIKLESTKDNFDDRVLFFTKEMRKQVALSRSLTSITKVRVYFDYLRERYRDISQNKFGRKVELLDLPGQNKKQRTFERQEKSSEKFE